MQCVPCESKKLSIGMGLPFDYRVKLVKDRKVNLVDDFQGWALLYYVNFKGWASLFYVIELINFNVGLSQFVLSRGRPSFTMSIGWPYLKVQYKKGLTSQCPEE